MIGRLWYTNPIPPKDGTRDLNGELVPIPDEWQVMEMLKGQKHRSDVGIRDGEYWSSGSFLAEPKVLLAYESVRELGYQAFIEWT